MKSKMNIRSHPLHPILVVFPIAFYTATMVFSFIGILTRNESFFTTSFYMNIAGIAGSLLAAIPGIIDYNYTVPPRSSAKRRAERHGLLNVLVLLLFIMALLVRLNFPAKKLEVLLIETAGVGFMIIAGWMGGTLVYRNQIGIDIRYSGAGKWKEKYLESDSSLINLGQVELQSDQMMLVHVQGKRIVVGKIEGGYVAFDDRCTHSGGSLAAGTLICGVVQCPWHGSQFDTSNGAAVSGPAHRHINSYPIYLQNDKLMVDLTPKSQLMQQVNNEENDLHV